MTCLAGSRYLPMYDFNSAPTVHIIPLFVSSDFAHKRGKKERKEKEVSSELDFEYLNRSANPRFLCIAEETGNDVVEMIVSPKMVAEAEVLCQYLCVPGGAANLQIDDVLDLPSSSPSPSSPILHAIRACPEPVAAATAAAAATRFESVVDCSDSFQEAVIESSTIKFVPSIRSGSYADIGIRKSMDDEHIRIDDLSAEMGSLFRCSLPSAFYAVFDGHGGPQAAAYIKRNAMRLFFEDVDIPQTSEINDIFLEELENCHRKAFLLADHALADECTVSRSCGTTALTALILGRHLLVANAGDCRAVLCRKGQAVEMSQDHKPSYLPERKRVEALGGCILDGFLNGDLSITRALGDWEMKFLYGSSSPLIAEPDFRQIILTEDDEFLIIGCDGIWDVMSSQYAVSLVRRRLRHHNNPQQCARDLVMEALRLNTLDNLTVIVVCFSSPDHSETFQPQRRRFRCCSLSEEARNRLKSLLEG